jgi:hypothetical protein
MAKPFDVSKFRKDITKSITTVELINTLRIASDSTYHTPTAMLLKMAAERLEELETEEDILEKTNEIMTGQPYDKRSVIPLELDKDDLYMLMLQAHEKDLTLNKYVESAIMEVIKKMEGTKNDEIN